MWRGGRGRMGGAGGGGTHVCCEWEECIIKHHLFLFLFFHSVFLSLFFSLLFFSLGPFTPSPLCSPNLPFWSLSPPFLPPFPPPHHHHQNPLSSLLYPPLQRSPHPLFSLLVLPLPLPNPSGECGLKHLNKWELLNSPSLSSPKS